jgi:nicotinamidase/pyrazinamidase
MKKIILFVIIGLFVIIAVPIVYLVIFESKSERVSQGTPIANYGTDKPALLVIDIQEVETGSLSDEECYTSVSDSVIGRTNRLITAMNKTGAPVIYVKSEITDWLINMLNDSYAKGSPGVALDKRLTVVSDYVIPKDCQDAFNNPRLDSILIEKKISHLIVTGLDAAFCVNSTVKAAKNRGYHISVITDAVISKTDSMKTANLNEFAGMGAALMTTQEFLETFKE